MSTTPLTSRPIAPSSPASSVEPARSGAGSADLNLLRTFLAVYRAGTFTAAAPLLGLSQPTVTSQIKALEKHIGHRLFDRGPRGVEPTAYASGLASRVAEALDSLADVDDAVCASGGRAAPVHLAGPAELLCTRLLPAVAPLVAEGVQVRLEHGVPEELIDGLREGRHDLVVTTRRPRGRSLESTPLADEEYLLVASPRWARWIAQERGDQELCTALKEVPLVSYAEDMPIVRRYWRTVFGRQHPPIGPALTVPNLHDVVAALLVVPATARSPGPSAPTIWPQADWCSWTTLWDGPLNTLFLVRRPGSRSNPDVARVHDALRADALCWNSPPEGRQKPLTTRWSGL